MSKETKVVFDFSISFKICKPFSSKEIDYIFILIYIPIYVCLNPILFIHLSVTKHLLNSLMQLIVILF